MLVGVLGPLELRSDRGGAAVALGAPKQRTVFALLALRVGALVPLSHLVDELWIDPPRSAVANVRTYSANLRRILAATCSGAVGLECPGPGYRLRVDPSEVDVLVFEQAAAAARASVGRGDLDEGVARFDAVLALWRGDPLVDVVAGPSISAWCAAIRDERALLVEERADACLQLNHVTTQIALLHEHIRLHPLREYGWFLLMTALCRAGDTAGALDAFRRARATLIEQLGVEPGRRLQQLHRQILDGALAATVGPVASVAVTATPPSPAQLPIAPTGFVGRIEQLAQLDSVLANDGAQPAAVVISAVTGTAGVGKTALAVHWAHRVRHRFPDGQLYVNLRGFDAGGRVMAPAEAVRSLLDGLGVPAERIPADLDAQVGLYRSMLAGKRVLVVLDNARDAGQVRPLLPGSPSALAIVTSRNQLTPLVAVEGALPLTLDLLSTAEARQLLTNRLGTNRTAVEPDAAQAIVTACARLPLALTIAAARAEQTGFPLASIAAELSDAGRRLDVLDAGDAAGQVRSVLSWSYATLSPSAARLFRLLGLHPGPDISAAAAASLAGRPLPAARSALTELARAHLLTEHAPGRYTFHDLLRLYAIDLAYDHKPGDRRHAATTRLLDHYTHTAHSAALQLTSYGRRRPLSTPQPGVVPEAVDDHAGATAWFAAEFRVLLALVERAAADGHDGHVWQLACAAWRFFEFNGHLDEWLTTARAAVAAADRLGDPLARNSAHQILAVAYARTKRYDEARIHLQYAVDQHAELNDEADYARLRLTQGWVAGLHGHHAEALDHALQAQEMFDRLGDRLGTAHALASVARHHANLGDHQRSLATAKRALAVHEHLHDAYGRADTLDWLAFAHYRLGDYPEATTHYERAVTLHRGLGDRYAEADTLHHLGDTHHAAGNHTPARNAWRTALNILTEIHHSDADTVLTKLSDTNQAPPRASH